MKLRWNGFWRRLGGYHPPRQPRYTGDLTPDTVARLLADCADLSRRNVRLGGAAGGVSAVLYYLDGLVDGDAVSRDVLRPLTEETRFAGAHSGEEAVQRLENSAAWFYSLSVSRELTQVMEKLLAGWCALVFQGAAVCFETKSGKGRSVEKPELEKSVKGAKDAFTETLRLNTALLRRRLKCAELKLWERELGRRSATKVSLLWLDGLTDRRVVQTLKQRLEDIDIDGLLSAADLEEQLLPRLSPFPQITLTERPDRFAMELLEGRAGILVDGIPLGFLLQSTLAEQLKVPEDQAGHWLVASLLTLLRYGAMLISVLLPAVYVAITMYHHEMIPTKLLISVIRTKQEVPFSTAAETLGMLLAFELLQEAGLRLPETIGETVSILGALIVGQSAVEASVLSPIVVIVVAVAGITGYTMPNQDLAAALRICRFLLVLLSLGFGLFGTVTGCLLLIWYLATLESFGTAYLYPFCGGTVREVLQALLRFPRKQQKYRPRDLHPENVRNQK